MQFRGGDSEWWSRFVTEFQDMLSKYSYGGLSVQRVLWIVVLSLVLPWIFLIFGVRPVRIQDQHVQQNDQMDQQMLGQEHAHQEQAQQRRAQNEDGE